MNWNFLVGYKTHALVALSVVAQIFGYIKPEYADVANKLSLGALSLTPTTIRMGVTSMAGSILASLPKK